MTGGQAIDLASEGKKLNVRELERMHNLKTGALLHACAMSACIVSDTASEADYEAIDHFGRSIGLAFQIRDDLLDIEGDPEVIGKAAGADELHDKATWPGLFGIEEYVERMKSIAASDQPFESKLMATITSHLTSYRERNEALKVHNDERLYLPEDKRAKLKELGSNYRQQLETIFEEGARTGVLRDTIDCHFAAQAVIGMCNGWGDIIVRDPDLDLFDLIQKCTDLVLNGFVERRKTRRDGSDAVGNRRKQ